MCDSRRTCWGCHRKQAPKKVNNHFMCYILLVQSLPLVQPPDFLSGSSAAGFYHFLHSCFGLHFFSPRISQQALAITAVSLQIPVSSICQFVSLVLEVKHRLGLPAPVCTGSFIQMCSNTQSSRDLSFWSSFSCFHALPGPSTISISFCLVIHNLCVNSRLLRTPFSLLMQVYQANTIFPSWWVHLHTASVPLTWWNLGNGRC